MTKYVGRKVDLGVGKETIRGTGVAPSFWIPKVDFSFDEKITKARVQSSLGTIQDSHQAHVLTKWGEGDVGAEVRDQSFGLFLYAMLGTLSSTGPTDSAYTHSFSIANTNTHQSLTFTVVDPNTTERYDLVMLNSLELTQELEDVLRYSASFMGKTSKGATGTASYTDENKFTKRHLSFKLAANLAALTASSAISLKSLTVTFNKNVVSDDVLGTAEPEDFLNQALSIEGNIALNYEDETYKGYMRNNTSRACEIAWTNTEQTVGAGSINPSLTTRYPKMDFFDWEPNYALDEIVTQGISFKANQDLANTEDMISTCDLVNAETGSNY